MLCKIKFKKGLTFVEVMYSCLLLAGSLILLSQFSSSSSSKLERSKRYSIVTQLMEDKLTELELTFHKEGSESLKPVEKEPFEDQKNFSWSLETKIMEAPNPADRMETLKEENQITDATNQIFEKISELVTEVRLTIHYEKQGKSSSYPITSYFIDFKKGQSQEFLLSAFPQNIMN